MSEPGKQVEPLGPERPTAAHNPRPNWRLTASLTHALPSRPFEAAESSMPESRLQSTLVELRRRVVKATRQGLNEQNTKATLIEPLLRALGWDPEDVEEVAREYRLKSRDKPVDYGLLVAREPRLFVEAKPLGEN